jgi:hypothetical protein
MEGIVEILLEITLIPHKPLSSVPKSKASPDLEHSGELWRRKKAT